MSHGAWYKRLVRPLLPRKARLKIQELFLPKAPEKQPPSPEALQYIIDRVRGDAEELRRIMGRTEPLWDFDAVSAKYRGKAPAQTAGRPAVS